MPILNRLSLIILLALAALLLAACRAADPPPEPAQPPPAAAPATVPAPDTTAQTVPAPAAAPDGVPGSSAADSGRPLSNDAEPEVTVREVIREVPVEVPVEVEKEAPAPQTEAMGAAPAGSPQGLTGPSGNQGNSVPAPTAAPAAQSAPQSAAPAAPAGGSTGPSQTTPQVSPPQPPLTTFQNYPRSPLVATWQDPVSTFSLDTDRASYRLALNWARSGLAIEPDSVRAEEWINAFAYGYDYPRRSDEFAITADLIPHPLDNGKHLARLAFQAPALPADHRPLNVTLVLDASGSMGEGNRVDIARAAATAIHQSLRPQDRIAVVHFSDDVLGYRTVPPVQPGKWASESIAALQPHAATNVQAGLDEGVQFAYQMRQERPDAWHYIILMSDGVANVDATNPFAILESTADNRTDNPLRLITIGVGIANYNDYLLEQLAQHGNGWYRYLNDPAQARTVFQRDNWLALASPFADQTRAQVTWNPELVSSWRIVGYENRVAPDHLFEQNRQEFAEIPSGAATTVFYELDLTARPSDYAGDWATVELRWVEPDSGQSRRQTAAFRGGSDRPFDRQEPLLQFSALVALAADRYSGLPYAAYYPDFSRDLSDLLSQLQPLSADLGQLTSYQDFAFLLEHITQGLPAHRPGDSGYSR